MGKGRKYGPNGIEWNEDRKCKVKVKRKGNHNSATVYVKDLKAIKLDARAQLGRFVGYDSESKGYRIYWPEKRSISIERNVVFNQDDIQTAKNTATIRGDSLDEGERDKIIQQTPNDENPENNTETVENHSELKNKLIKTYQDNQSSNSIPFPSTSQPKPDKNPEAEENDQNQQYSRGQCQRKPPGAYNDMNEGLVASIAQCNGLRDETESIIDIPEDDNTTYNLPPDFALIGGLGSDPCLLDEALRGLNAREWQTALDYEISQLEKLGTWVIEDLPKGHSTIPCGEVLKVKQGPNGEIQSYQV